MHDHFKYLDNRLRIVEFNIFKNFRETHEESAMMNFQVNKRCKKKTIYKNKSHQKE